MGIEYENEQQAKEIILKELDAMLGTVEDWNNKLWIVILTSREAYKSTETWRKTLAATGNCMQRRRKIA